MWQWVSDLLERLLTWFVNWVEGFMTFWRGVGQLAIDSALSWGHTLFPTVSWSTVQSYMDQLNYVLPVGETIVLCGAYLALWSGVWAYRAVKSWIPTVSGS